MDPSAFTATWSVAPSLRSKLHSFLQLPHVPPPPKVSMPSPFHTDKEILSLEGSEEELLHFFCCGVISRAQVVSYAPIREASLVDFPGLWTHPLLQFSQRQSPPDICLEILIDILCVFIGTSCQLPFGALCVFSPSFPITRPLHYINRYCSSAISNCGSPWETSLSTENSQPSVPGNPSRRKTPFLRGFLSTSLRSSYESLSHMTMWQPSHPSAKTFLLGQTPRPSSFFLYNMICLHHCTYGLCTAPSAWQMLSKYWWFWMDD